MLSQSGLQCENKHNYGLISGLQCENKHNYGLIFSSNEFDDCRNDCFLSIVNKTYGCVDIPKDSFDLNVYLDIDKHLLSMGYKVCSTKFLFNTTFGSKLNDICSERCVNCNSLRVQTNIVTQKHSNQNNTSMRIEIIPDNSPHIKYIEKLQTDINQLIYTLGGIIGLWFGLSPKQIPDLFINLLHLLKALVNSCTNFDCIY